MKILVDKMPQKAEDCKYSEKQRNGKGDKWIGCKVCTIVCPLSLQNRGECPIFTDNEGGSGEKMKCKNCKNYELLNSKGEQFHFCDAVLDSRDGDVERECKYYEVMTNADRIRNMTDDELAVFLAKTRSDIDVLSACVIPYRGENVIRNLEWLEKKVEE